MTTSAMARDFEERYGGRDLRVVGIVGSLRERSWNRKLFEVAVRVLQRKGVDVDELDLAALPMYHPEVERAGIPTQVAAFREALRRSDAVVIVSPEYNASVPGVLKNAIDWASRPTNVLQGKAALIMGASPGRLGAARMYTHLSDILAALDVWVVPQPRVLLPGVDRLFTSDGELADPSVEALIEQGSDRLLRAGRTLQVPD